MLEDQQFIERLEEETGVAYNAVQKEAICHTEGPLLLLATPGAGKTTVLNARVLYLIQCLGVNPEHILALTFSKAAAKEMGDRFFHVFGHRVKERVRFSTIHSFSYQIVRGHFHEKRIAYDLIENAQGAQSKNAVLKQIYENCNHAVLTEDKLEELGNAICFIKNSMLPLTEINKLDYKIKNLEAIYCAYENYKQTAHPDRLLLDFDDMLTLANQILEEYPDLLARYQSHYQYILTDESQDTSLIQHKIIEKVAKPRNNLFVVGDDDQSIFGFRSANPKYLLEFKAIYPSTRILMMEQNYRSTQAVVKVTDQFIRGNHQRYRKNMYTKNPAGPNVRIQAFDSDHQQIRYLIETLRKSETLEDKAVLYRNNVSAINLVDQLASAEIPFYVRDSGYKFFNHWVIQDILNFMRFSYSDKNVELLERIYTKCNAFISKQQLEFLKGSDPTQSVFDHLAGLPKLPEFRKRNFLILKDQFKKLNTMPPLDAIRFIRRDLHYDEKLEEISERLGHSMETILGILTTLENIADGKKTLKDFADRLKQLEVLMREAALNTSKNAVTLSTFHSAKGLEFDTVYMIDLVDGVIPNLESIRAAEKNKEDALEEERRLFYVGMTRAKRVLELLTVDNLNGQEVVESRFIGEVREILQPYRETKTLVASRSEKSTQRDDGSAVLTTLKIEKGATIRHKAFGIGQIERVAGDIVEVRFRKLGVKQLSLQVCQEGKLIGAVL